MIDMTKKAATQAARNILRYGHFTAGPDSCYQTYNGHRVVMYGSRGRPTGPEMTKQLAQAIIEIETGDWETCRG